MKEHLKVEHSGKEKTLEKEAELFIGKYIENDSFDRFFKYVVIGAMVDFSDATNSSLLEQNKELQFENAILQTDNVLLIGDNAELKNNIKNLLNSLEADNKIYKQYNDFTELRINQEFIDKIKSILL